MTKVVFEFAARKALKAMPTRDAAALERKLTVYAQTGVGDVVKLTGVAKWRLRHGDWRAIFVRRNDVVVIQIAHRREVYR